MVALSKRVSKNARKFHTISMPFLIPYMCEAAFSALVYLKNKYLNRLDVEENLKIKLTSFFPNLKLLSVDKQHHHSH